MRIVRAKPDEAEALTEIAFAAKRHWGYPEKWIESWRETLTVTPEFIASHETYVATWIAKVTERICSRCGCYPMRWAGEWDARCSFTLSARKGVGFSEAGD